jgi:hypothetical protein
MKLWMADFVWGLASAYVLLVEWEALAEVVWLPTAVCLVLQAATLVLAWRWRSWRSVA